MDNPKWRVFGILHSSVSGTWPPCSSCSHPGIFSTSSKSNLWVFRASRGGKFWVHNTLRKSYSDLVSPPSLSLSTQPYSLSSLSLSLSPLCLFIYAFVHLSLVPCICLPIYICLSVCPSVCPCILPCTRLLNCPAVHPGCPSVCPSFHLSNATLCLTLSCIPGQECKQLRDKTWTK